MTTPIFPIERLMPSHHTGPIRLWQHPLRAAPGRRTLLVACRPYGQPLHANPHRLHLLLTVANANGGGGIDLYEVSAR